MLGLGASMISAAAIDALNALLAAVKARATTYENQDGTLTIIDEFTSDGLLDSATILTTPTAHSDAVLHSLKDGTSDSDFDVTSDTDATRINENGLLEDIAANQPRINYEPSASGVVANNAHILLEPTRTNLAVRSGDATQWIWGRDSNPNSTTRVDGQTDPYGGTSASQFTRDAGTGGWFSNANNPTGSAVDYTHSIFVKQPASNASDTINMRNVNASGAPQVTFTFSSESFTTEVNATGSFEKFPNGYYRLSMTFANGAASTAQTRHTLDDGEALIVFGIQFEEGSFSTSYIPTTSSSVTRTKGKIKDSGNTSLIDSTQGTLYCEISGSFDGSRHIGLSGAVGGSPANHNAVYIGLNGSNQPFGVVRVDNDSNVLNRTTTIDASSSFVKCAIKWSSSDMAFYVNGSKIGTTETSPSATFSADELDTLSFDRGNDQFIFTGKCKAVAVYTTALSDSDMAALTS